MSIGGKQWEAQDSHRNLKRKQFVRSLIGVIEPGIFKAQVGNEIGINPKMLGRWGRELTKNGPKAFLGKGKARNEKVAALKCELNRLKKERDFSREATTFYVSN